MSLQRILEQFLGWCTKKIIARDHPTIIAVAGSVGKSSTKTAIGIALGVGEKGSTVVASEKSYNNELGVPITVFGSPAPGRSLWRWIVLITKAKMAVFGFTKLRAQTFVLEMATDHPGNLAYLTRIAPPSISVLTAIGPEHTEYFGSIEEVIKEEAIILAALPNNGVAVTNADDDAIRKTVALYPVKDVSFGMADDATVHIRSTRIVINPQSPEESGIEVAISLYSVLRTFLISGTIGRPQAYAAAAGIAVGSVLDVDTDEIIDRLTKRFHGMSGRMRLLEGIKHTWLIDDSYNSSPLSVLSALRDLAAFPVAEGARRIAAMGDMLELGNLTEEAHREMGHAAAENGIDMFIACGTLAHIAAESAVAAGMPVSSVFTFAKSSDVGLFIQERLQEHDVVLVKGSQSVRMERICKELMAHPDKADELLVRHTSDWINRP